MSIRQKLNKYSLFFNLSSFHAVTPVGILFSLIFFLIPACKKDLSPVKDRQIEIKLTVESAEVTEAWLKLETSPLESEAVYIVKRDTHFVFNGKLDKSDTLLHDENLLPAHDYNYSAYAVLNCKTGKIVKASLTTMDTTSHDFEWEVFEFGVKSSSVLHDVAIISPEDIWAVGEIYTEDSYTYDSLGNWIEPYNAVHWDGEKWELKRLLFNGNWAPKYSVFAFNSNDVWFGTSSMIHYDGNKFHPISVPSSVFNSRINKIWGTSGSDLYIVGNNGLIAHYNGQSWQKIESGTDVDLVDVWGTNDNNIWICGYTQLNGTVILHYNGEKWSKWFWSPYEEYINLNPNKISGPIVSIWTDSEYYLWLVTYWGLYKVNNRDPTDFKRYPDVNAWNGYIYRIRGQSDNSLVFAGDLSAIWHYNGNSLYYYSSMSGYASL
ncbi:MAG: hypothetical protein K8R79_08875, partial [Calditrichales bacterium]|nr:hypothetical protein [Calditrichales bacterium]